MGEISFKAPRERGLPRIPAVWLLAFLLSAGGSPAFAQEQAPACAPAIARVVSLQGTVEVQRAGTASWLAVRRLDTSICAGDRLRTASASRAMLYVQPETLVRLDQQTTLVLQQSTDEISVEFSADEVSHVACSEQTCGAGYFITRFPKKFKVKTPHMNAAVEGTEFMVAVGRDSTQLTVLEGKVASEAIATGNRQLVGAGHSIASGAAGAGAITAVVKPEDAVQWVLWYPPLSDAGVEGDATPSGNAEELLKVGQVDKALREIDSVLADNSTDAAALALRAIIQIAKNDKAAALESAKSATDADAANYRGWLALSYARQASFELEGALASARRAQELESNSSLLHARVAELQLSLGQTKQAEVSARAAVQSNPRESAAHTILGFVRLAEMDTDAARAVFAAAIEQDSFNSLPRLGLGLAMIRDGELAAGREQLEIAVALDPGSSLVRSYVGKAYYEENTPERNVLAAAQFDAAAKLDPSDPTPHLYDSIRLQTSNRPVEALRAIQESIRLNDNRAVYRSELKLDEDLAVRGASQGRIYRDLGYEALAIQEGWQSIDADSGEFAGHRLLADTYSGKPGHEMARVNELYVSQLLQPLNLNPIPPQLGEANLFILDSAGPSDISFNEFNPLFARNRVALHASATAGSNDTWGDDVSIAAIHDRWSLSMGQFHFETDGFRPNNDLDQDVYNAFAQFRQSDVTSWVSELRVTRREQGDLRLMFDPANFNSMERQHEDTESVRVGVAHAISVRSELLATLAYQAADYSLTDLPFFELDGDVDSYTGQLQYHYRGDRWRFIGGLRHSRRDQSELSVLTIPLPFPPFVFQDTQLNDVELDNTTAYGYAYFNPADTLTLILGGSYDSIETRVIDREQGNPKLGLAWEPTPLTRLRLAVVRSVQPDAYSRQDIPPRLEPTQVAGFNQAFFGRQAEREWRYGLGADHEISQDLHLGVELVKRDIDTPLPTFGGSPGDAEVFSSTEDLAHAYVFWTPNAYLSISAAYRFDERNYEGQGRSLEGIDELRTHRLPLSVRYFHPSGFGAEAQVTYVDQKGTFFSFIPVEPFELLTPGADQFWVLDTAIRYRLPRRKGIISLGAQNLLDEEFQFQDYDPANPEIVPERFVTLKLTIAF